jgi:hypothetical protein
MSLRNFIKILMITNIGYVCFVKQNTQCLIFNHVELVEFCFEAQ